jgi:hypothetical protein
MDGAHNESTIELRTPIRSPGPGRKARQGARPKDEGPIGIAPSMMYAKCAIHGSRIGRRSPPL